MTKHEPPTLSVERMSLEKAGAVRRVDLLFLHDDGQRSQAAALRPWALQVLLAVPLQTLQPQDTDEKVFTPVNYTLYIRMTELQTGALITWCCRGKKLDDLSERGGGQRKEVETSRKQWTMHPTWWNINTFFYYIRKNLVKIFDPNYISINTKKEPRFDANIECF